MPLSHRFFLFHQLNDETLALIDRELSDSRRYERGAHIYDTHTFERALGLIESGSVLVSSPDENGHPLLMARLGAGDVFGAAALFDEQQADYVTQLTAESAVCVRFITQEEISSLFVRFPQIAQNYITFLSGRVRFLNRKLSVLTGGPSVNRVYQYFLSHQREDGTIALPPSHTELAQVLNMGRSSLYRSLDTLLAQGIVKKDGKTYTLIQ